MDIKKLKLEKKIHLTNEVRKALSPEVKQVDNIKDNSLLLKTQINGKIVYYKIVISEITKNIEEWTDLVEEYKIKKGIKK